MPNPFAFLPDIAGAAGRAARVLPAAILVLAAGPAAAQSLRDAIGIALTESPRVLQALGSARAAGFDIEAAQAVRNPRYSVIADPGYTAMRRDDNPRSRGNAGDIGVRANILVYDGGRSGNEIERQRFRQSNALNHVDAVRVDLALRVADAYVEVIKQRRLVDIAEQNLASHEGIRDRVQEIVRIDRGRNYDLLQTESRTQGASITVTQRRGLQAEAQTALDQLVGRHVEAVEFPDDPERGLPPTLQSGLDDLAQHPALLAAQNDVDVARKQSDVAAAWAQPRVDLQGTVNSRSPLTGERQTLGVYDVRLVSQWTPFDGGVGRANARAALAAIDVAQDGVAATRRDLSTELARNWTQAQTRIGRAAAQQRLAEQAQRVRDAYWEQFRIGKRSILDLLNTETEIFLARLNAEIERLELMQARYRVLGAQGSLLDFLGMPLDTAHARTP